MILQTSDKKQTLDMLDKFSSLSVRVVLELVNTDASGNTSGTETLNGGTKAKKINITAQLAMKDASSLSKLIKVAESTEESGQRTVYTVSDDTADAVDIREVIFHDRLEINKADKLLALNIGFTLLEYKSVPEVAEQRSQSGITPTGGGVEGEEVADEATIGAKGRFYDLLKKADKYLGEVFNDENNNVS